MITHVLEVLNLRATDHLRLDNFLKNSLAKTFNTLRDTVVLHDSRFYLDTPSMKALCMARQMKFLTSAVDLINVAVQTALLVLQNQLISMCNSINVDIDCSYGGFYFAGNSCNE